jgi:MerR family copper efflux transcriptional regulator
MTRAPIACTLSPQDMAARHSLIDRLAAEAMLDRVATDTGVRIRLRATPDLERRARELAAAEARCCPFLTFEIACVDDALVLDVSGPPEVRPVIDLFFAPEAV